MSGSPAGGHCCPHHSSEATETRSPSSNLVLRVRSPPPFPHPSEGRAGPGRAEGPQAPLTAPSASTHASPPGCSALTCPGHLWAFETARERPSPTHPAGRGRGPGLGSARSPTPAPAHPRGKVRPRPRCSGSASCPPRRLPSPPASPAGWLAVWRAGVVRGESPGLAAGRRARGPRPWRRGRRPAGRGGSGRGASSGGAEGIGKAGRAGAGGPDPRRLSLHS